MRREEEGEEANESSRRRREGTRTRNDMQTHPAIQQWKTILDPFQKISSIWITRGYIRKRTYLLVKKFSLFPLSRPPQNNIYTTWRRERCSLYLHEEKAKRYFSVARMSKASKYICHCCRRFCSLEEVKRYCIILEIYFSSSHSLSPLRSLGPFVVRSLAMVRWCGVQETEWFSSFSGGEREKEKSQKYTIKRREREWKGTGGPEKDEGLKFSFILKQTQHNKVANDENEKFCAKVKNPEKFGTEVFNKVNTTWLRMVMGEKRTGEILVVMEMWWAREFLMGEGFCHYLTVVECRCCSFWLSLWGFSRVWLRFSFSSLLPFESRLVFIHFIFYISRRSDQILREKEDGEKEE